MERLPLQKNPRIFSEKVKYPEGSSKDDRGFIKTSSLPSDKKAALNRKGNELFNSGDIEKARRVFVTTGYSDGLIRVGDADMKAGDPVKALKMYMAAGEKRKAAAITEKMAMVIRYFLEEEH
jgi:hypothetical protein